MKMLSQKSIIFWSLPSPYWSQALKLSDRFHWWNESRPAPVQQRPVLSSMSVFWSVKKKSLTAESSFPFTLISLLSFSTRVTSVACFNCIFNWVRKIAIDFRANLWKSSTVAQNSPSCARILSNVMPGKLQKNPEGYSTAKFYTGSSTPRDEPLPSYIPFMMEKVAISFISFIEKPWHT